MGPLVAEGRAFDPEQTKIMSVAFESAWQSLQAAGSMLALEPQASQTRDAIARRIIELAQLGEFNAEALRERALHFVNFPPGLR